MSLVEFSTAAHLGGSAILALFFVLLARHDPRPYLRDWTLAWVAQVLALLVAIAPRLGTSIFGESLSSFLEAIHGLLLCSAAYRYARGRGPRRRSGLVLLPIAAACAWAAITGEGDGRVPALGHVVLALCYGVSSALLWRLRETSAMGLRLVTTVLALGGLVFLVLAVLLGGVLPPGGAAEVRGAIPVVILCLQLLLSLGMVLAFMETSQADLHAANERLEQAQQQLKSQAETDPLTGCFNRRIFRELVDQVRADASAVGVILLLDMDGLKKLNDAQGHSAGDRAIRRIADALRVDVQESDRLIRWGGDEFVLVLQGAAEADGRKRLERIGAAIEASGFQASAGLAAYGAAKDIVTAMREADQAMYRAKADKRR